MLRREAIRLRRVADRVRAGSGLGGRRTAVSAGAALMGEKFKNLFPVGKVGRGKVRGLGEGEGDGEH